MRQNEPIYDDLQKRGIGFRSLNANDHRLWPSGRGLYVNAARTQAILVNEDDHLRFICKESSGEYGELITFVFDGIPFFSVFGSTPLFVFCLWIALRIRHGLRTTSQFDP